MILIPWADLAASLAGGVAAEFVRQRGGGGSSEGSAPGLLLNEANVNRLVDKLSQMRGAALKLGQFLSIQDAHVLPPEVERVFRRVQDRAHYMPNWQMEQVMREDLGPDWASHFASFERVPFASASIGQVHLATLSSPEGPKKVAVKIQFPNVARSIGADLAAIGLLLPAARLLPRGLFLERTLKILGQELEEECDYTREAAWARQFREWLQVGGVGRGGEVEGLLDVTVPWIWEGSTKRVLVMEFVEGVSVGGDIVQRLPQAEKDLIASTIIHLCLRELFTFRAMQTDPNWTNFLYTSDPSPSLGLVDFGATRAYSKTFIDDWLRLLRGAIDEDEDACYEMSKRLGYLTGEENEAMRTAHIRSMILLGTPFRTGPGEPFSFARTDSQWPRIAAEIRAQIPVMLQNRLVPPPRETLSLNRKLSGAFLLAARLDARVDCRSLWHAVTDGYTFGGDPLPSGV
ncbi:ABC1-domain-containing protein [Exidia glandulosa HHB12029]|uniref:ABC1-domain-containing protein n=1 Tax=Exidia glandulosa HHB12029 TaxID=1314781 RepID=A0A165EB15_EXIGL|nr:ABC1-domain-containing protein [Exidia glandulosa HHB12029]